VPSSWGPLPSRAAANEAEAQQASTQRRDTIPGVGAWPAGRPTGAEKRGRGTSAQTTTATCLFALSVAGVIADAMQSPCSRPRAWFTPSRSWRSWRPLLPGQGRQVVVTRVWCVHPNLSLPNFMEERRRGIPVPGRVLFKRDKPRRRPPAQHGSACHSDNERHPPRQMPACCAVPRTPRLAAVAPPDRAPALGLIRACNQRNHQAAAAFLNLGRLVNTSRPSSRSFLGQEGQILGAGVIPSGLCCQQHRLQPGPIGA